MVQARTRIVRPQPGPQSAFLASNADIVIYGGAAGGGKTFGLLMEDLYELKNPEFASVTFRRTYPMITNPGGLWPESFKVYGPLGSTSKEDPLGWVHRSGAISRFAHLQHDGDMYSWQGAQVPVIKFDELTHFTQGQFFYLGTRNRNTAGIHSRIRGTCNADADSWVADFIRWWWDPDTGYAIPERAGKVRYFARAGDEILWADDPLDLPRVLDDEGEIVPPKSCTFIPAKLSDNPLLLEADPGYRAALFSADLVTQERLIRGNWLIRYRAGTMFRREWFTEVVDRAPDGLGEIVRYWDTAATPVEVDGKIVALLEDERAGADPDWTVGVKMARKLVNVGEKKVMKTFVLDVVRERLAAGDVEALIRATALADGRHVKIRMEQEGGASGKSMISHFRRNVLKGFDFAGVPSSGNKVVRAKAYSAECQQRNVILVAGPWNTPYLVTLCAFPTKGVHDDDVDASSGAYNFLTRVKGTFASW